MSSRATHPEAHSSELGSLSIAVAHVVVLGALLGTIVGLGLGLHELSGYADGIDRVYARVLASEVTRAVAAAMGFLALWLLLRGAVARAPKPGLVATALLWLPPALLFGHWLNVEHLPGFFEARSIGANLAVGLGLVLLLLVLSWGLERWRTRALGGAVPRAGALVVLLPLALWVLDVLDSRSREEGPDVVVILIDVLRADHVSCYGYGRNTTPAIDALAADGILFEQAVSQGTFTKTSVASLFSGVYPFKHGVYHGGPRHRGPNGEVTTDMLASRFTTVAESAAAAGYLTVAWVENPQLRAYMGFDQGFARYHDQPGHVETIRREFLDWADDFGRRRRFFAYLHILDLHGPYLPKPPYDTRYGRYTDAFDGMTWQSWRKYRGDVESGRREALPEELEQLKSLYDGQLTYIDEEVGKILEELKALDLYDDSLIVVVSDHGEGFMEHGFVAHTNVPYDELSLVPLVVKLPGGHGAGTRIAEPVPLVDLVPTIEEVIGVRESSKRSERDGRSLTPFADRARASRPGGDVIGGDVIEPGGARPVYTETAREIAIRSGDWKYILSMDADPELYDLANDPGEQRNVIAENPDVAEALGTLARQTMEERTPERTQRRSVDPETAKRLEELGYL